jgi:hypothetical protein
MSAASITQSISWRFIAIVVTLLLFAFAAYLVSAFIWLLPHAYARETSGTLDALLFAARSVPATYPGTLMTPAFLGAGLSVIVTSLWQGKPPLLSALIPWLLISLAIAGYGLYLTETTVTGLARAWPSYLSDAIIACLCWAVARLFW